MSKHLAVPSSLLVLLTLAACNGISPKIGTVNGDGDTKVDRVEVGSVGGNGTTQVDTVNANISMGGILGNPYTIVKTSVAVLGCRNEQYCRCQLVPQKVGVLSAKGDVFYVSKLNSSRTMFGCMMNSRAFSDASKANVNIVPSTGEPVPGTPLGSAKSLDELNAAIK